jgi:hypothetical protein
VNSVLDSLLLVHGRVFRRRLPPRSQSSLRRWQRARGRQRSRPATNSPTGTCSSLPSLSAGVDVRRRCSYPPSTPSSRPAAVLDAPRTAQRKAAAGVPHGRLCRSALGRPEDPRRAAPQPRRLDPVPSVGRSLAATHSVSHWLCASTAIDSTRRAEDSTASRGERCDRRDRVDVLPQQQQRTGSERRWPTRPAETWTAGESSRQRDDEDERKAGGALHTRAHRSSLLFLRSQLLVLASAPLHSGDSPAIHIPSQHPGLSSHR